MNIEGVNLSSLLPGNSAIEEGARSLPENGSVSEGFTNALMGQIDLLSEVNSQVELPGQLQSTTMPQAINNLSDADKGDEEELVALFSEYLPLSKKNEDTDLEATLLTVSDALKPIEPSSTSDEVTTAQNMSNAMVLNGLSFANPLPEEETNAASEDFLSKATILRQSIQNAQDFNLQVLNEKKMVLNGLPPSEEADAVSGDFLQKETVMRQLIQDKLGVNFQYVENPVLTEKTLMLEKQASILGVEQAEPGVAANMVQFHSPVDNRTDIPAITRPLTHPDWGKDLGEQIVWMANKAIPAAEIKLNPAHLGPISVRIDVNQDQATIMFTTHHAEVKEAIEASIPKLREMLGTQQLNLVNVNVSQNSTPDHGRSQPQTFFKTPENSDQGIEGVTDTLEKTENNRVIVSKGLLSIYA
jgi:hypothetical protein